MFKYQEVNQLDEELCQFHFRQVNYYQIENTELSVESIKESMQAPVGFVNNHHIYKIYHNKQMIGYIDYLGGYRYSMQHDADYLWIGLFLVDQDHQHLGYGRTIIHHFIDIWKLKYHYIQLACIKDNHAGLTFWQSLGFQKINEAKAGQNDCLVLELHLS